MPFVYINYPFPVIFNDLKVISVMKIVAITNRHLAPSHFWDQLQKIAASDIDSIVLREKDLSEEDYAEFALRALQLCSVNHKECVLHHFGKAAVRLHVPRIQCSLDYLKTHTSLTFFMKTIGVSVHSAEEAIEAEKLGATYIMASHVFPTACKPKDKPIGVETVRAICDAVSIPVYALGGINEETLPKLKDVPIAGIAIMSSAMENEDVATYVDTLRSICQSS